MSAYIRDATGVSTSVKGIRLNFCDVNWRPPQTLVARKMLTDTVTAAQSTKTKSIQIDGKIHIYFRSLCESLNQSTLLPLFRTSIHRHSNRWAMVRAMARNIFIRSVTIWSRIYQTFPRLSHCSIHKRSKYIRNGPSVNATSSSNAKCNASKSAEMVYNRCIKLLCVVAWSNGSRQRDQVNWDQYLTLRNQRNGR